MDSLYIYVESTSRKAVHLNLNLFYYIFCNDCYIIEIGGVTISCLFIYHNSVGTISLKQMKYFNLC